MSITNGVRSPKDIELKVVDLVESGLTTRQVAAQVDICQKTVSNIMARYEKTEHATIQKLSKCTGVAAMRFAMMLFDKLTLRFEKESDSWNPAQMAVMAGIATQRAHEIFDKPQDVLPPDWSKLSIAESLVDPTKNIESKIVEAE